MLFEKKILYETKNHNPPCKLSGRSLSLTQYTYINISHLPIHFPYDLTEWYYQYQHTDSDWQIFICQCDLRHIIMWPMKTITKTSITARPLEYWTCCHTSDHVFLNLCKCLYSIYIQLYREANLCYFSSVNIDKMY